MTLADFPAALVARVERTLVDGLALTPRAIDPRFAHAQGTLREAPATLVSRVYDGPAIRHARFVELRSAGFSAGNILVLPRDSYPWPVLGIDVVHARADSLLLVADLSPLVRDEATDTLVAHHLAALAPIPSAGPLPDWCARWFSAHAVYARVSHGHVEALTDAVHVLASTLVAVATRVHARSHLAHEVRVAQRAYLADHRAHDRASSTLAQIFGDEFATAFRDAVLFPDVPDAPTVVPPDP